MFCGAWFAYEWRRQRRGPDDVLITERRLLYADSAWDDKAEAMVLCDVERISWSALGPPGALEVTGAGHTRSLPLMRETDAIASALGRATGKPHPRPLGPMAFVDLT